MHGYYYDQNRVYPPEDQDRRRRPGRRGPGKAVVLFCCALALLLVAAVVLRWVGDSLSPREDLFHSGDKSPENTPYDWGDTWDWEDEETGETTVERAPLGDDVTLTLTPQPQTEAHTLQTIYQENIQSIVSIWGDAGTSYSFGTGVVLSADGYIITNTHVIEGCSSVEVVLQDDSSYEALLVGMDVPTDLAVLKIDAQNLHPAVFGNSDELQVGDTVLIFDIDKKATVLELPKDGDQVLVQAGIIKTRVPMSNLRLVKEPPKEAASGPNRRQRRVTRSVARGAQCQETPAGRSINEVDLRGQTTEEALMTLDQYIDHALLTGVHQITIIHGKGTGALRKAVQEHLRHHPSIGSFRLGVFGEGESGVTIAELK